MTLPCGSSILPFPSMVIVEPVEESFESRMFPLEQQTQQEPPQEPPLKRKIRFGPKGQVGRDR